MRNGFRLTLVAGAALTLSAALAACVVDEGPRPLPPRPGPGGGDMMCTQQYDPVCGERRGRQQTFGNACEAERAGYRILRGGECRGPDRPGPGRPGGPGGPGAGPGWPGGPGMGPGPRPPRPDRPGGPGGGAMACPMIYDPVCGARGNRQQTFGNSCEAESSGFRVVRRGQC